MSESRIIGNAAKAEVDKAATKALRDWGSPGLAVAVVKDGEVFLQGYGVREKDTSDPVTPDTVFAIASTSKAFTTTAIAMLVDEGKMAWDDPVRKHLSWFHLSDSVADASVTIRDLVSHRSGLPRHDALWFLQDWSREETVRRFCGAGSSTPIRSTYEYSNIPYMAAALALEAVSGLSWEDFVKQRLFRPLGMKTACFSVKKAQALADHASPHEKFKGKMTVIDWLDMDCEGPAGGINANVRDLSRWVEFQLGEGEFRGKRLLSRDALQETHKPCVTVPVTNPDKHGLDFGVNISSYCLGWILHDYRGHTIIGHSGLIDGFTALVSLVKRENMGVVVLANSAGGNIVHAVTREVLDILLGLPRWKWTSLYKSRTRAEKAEEKKKKSEEKEKNPRLKRTRPSLPLSSYCGKYEDGAYGGLSISQDNSSLVLEYGRVKTHLKHYHLDVFTFKVEQPGYSTEGKAQFLPDINGRPSSVRIEGMLAREFRRVE